MDSPDPCACVKQAVSQTPEVVRSTAADIASTLRGLDADVILLQEVDRRSRRTGKIDELKILRDGLPDHGCWCSAAYWRVPYVPSPKQEHVGRIGMHLAVLSRYRLGRATRTQLPLLDEPLYRKCFNLRRCPPHPDPP